MTEISKRLEQIVRKELSNNIIPVKTEDGILVGSVLISTDGYLKTIKRQGQELYTDINLNKAAIAIAEILARFKTSFRADQIYQADQEYGKWFVDSQMLRAHYESAVKNRDFDKADVMWARYQESRSRTVAAKNKALSLCNI
jgi:hypothetical protein